ncbi:A disintegrin and metalloproteinase with thrombospondin motifs 3 [Fasciola hepatica]|uniref:A disintegrin and metalloproteinase with thrombospondin motifs 3 n=1 Tax=Fasciola hepatica TaxID=6192 RepID=A0A4E0RXL5_FASHE|nr:A disintegrin and metalloproteinase with thrombospondin motifs 3 [Fasciola hepatica]
MCGCVRTCFVQCANMKRRRVKNIPSTDLSIDKDVPGDFARTIFADCEWVFMLGMKTENCLPVFVLSSFLLQLCLSSQLEKQPDEWNKSFLQSNAPDNRRSRGGKPVRRTQNGDMSLSPAEQNYWIETLVFADHTVRQRFGTLDEAQRYVITLMSLTNRLFHLPSLGTNLSLSMRNIIWVGEEKSNELLWGPSLIRSVHRFCTWAMTNYYVRYNYDHALFISRNIVQAAGISPLSQMCRMQHSCTLAEDSGFFSAYPIAHEVMHSLGVEHDGEGNGCDASGVTGNIMAPLILSASHNHHWSDCTRLVLQAGLSSRKFGCLRDYPVEEDHLKLHEASGKYWDLNQQCNVLSGSNASRHCPGVEEHACQELWCSVTGSADQCDRMLNHGLLDGTECGLGKRCFDGKCVTDPVQLPDADGWSSFSDWTVCSRTCGIGTQYRKRVCLTGLSTCPGRDTEYRLCQGERRDCPSSVDLRQQQCQWFNSFKLQGVYHTWLPYIQSENSCKLSCFSQQSGQLLDGSVAVRDATRCTYDNPDSRCVQGACIDFDCMGHVNGTSRRDLCGICEGDGSKCELISHQINRTILSTDGYRIVYIIPRHSRELEVTHNSSDHVLALFDMSQLEFLFNEESVPPGKKVRRVFFATEFCFERAITELDQFKVFRVSAKGPVVGDMAIRVRQTGNFTGNPWIAVRVSYIVTKE